ncbi:leucine--tRNA ligase [uncultured Rikenella sp.]|uniref:leucine--tRNA ligase n=1 Tax=uncultured Rikenella sp. TaxID=368003 RepID=UPI00260A4540|nr:leucine--tRNA ligase [uncultured Rikenella sp.]
MEYDFREIERKWQRRWAEAGTYRVAVDSSRPKYYVLDMFPYPSGAGLHVGHPLGYIASDIYSRYKRQKGFNVLHPMGYDAFGLPAEQYAIQTGQHPAVTTEQNIARYREQLDKIGFGFDWEREVRTCDPGYYKWTQWAFEKMYDSYYCNDTQQARPIAELEEAFGKYGNEGLNAACGRELRFTAEEWNAYSPKEKSDVLMNYRLAFQADTVVNWCEGLGTVLANDEVKDGLSVRGGFPVEQKRMRQWLLRVTAYAERLLAGLDGLEWSESLKEIQRNWIGRSTGATMYFPIKGFATTGPEAKLLEIFTTRADTVFGVTFMVLAPEHAYIREITTPEQREAVEAYIAETKKRSERERMADTRRVSGVFTGAYAVNPFNGVEIPIWVSDYVLAGYGTGAIMAVPAHDSRDWAFAKHFDLPIIPIIECDVTEGSYDAKEGRLINSDFLTGLDVKEAIPAMFAEIERRGVGCKKVNYRLRDAIFSRQRYWGEPFPVSYDSEGIPRLVPEAELPLVLPETDNFTPTADGRPPLARIDGWRYETSTMPGFAGSSAYYLRYMDPKNDTALVSKEANDYWRSVDLYVGGIEHATGHLIYSRFWNKFLYDLGYVCEDEPFKKLVNQGMIQGRSNFVYRIKGTNRFVSLGLKEQYDTQEIHVDVNIVKNDVLDIDAFRAWRPEFADAEFVLEPDGRYVCGWAVEKMSKSMYNVVNPDFIVDTYGADTLRMYEMFLGPLEQSKPWDTNGIDGVHKFLKRLWRLVEGVADAPATDAERKTLHKAIKKVGEDIENFSFNTAVSAFMICLNELCDRKTSSREILEPLVALVAPFAPHIAEELWHGPLGHAADESVCDAPYPECDEKYLVESTFEYPVSFNGKTRFKRTFDRSSTPDEITAAIQADEQTAKYTDGRPIRKVIVVPGKIINVVC